MRERSTLWIAVIFASLVPWLAMCSRNGGLQISLPAEGGCSASQIDAGECASVGSEDEERQVGDTADLTPPTCTLTASQISVPQGTTIALTLVTSGSVTSRKIDGTEVGAASPTISRAPQAAATYLAYVEGGGGVATCTATVDVTARTYCVTVYLGADFTGSSKTYQTGQVTYAYLDGWNDQISSLKVHPGCSVKLYQHDGNAVGWDITYTTDQSKLGKTADGYDVNDQVSRLLCSCP